MQQFSLSEKNLPLYFYRIARLLINNDREMKDACVFWVILWHYIVWCNVSKFVQELVSFVIFEIEALKIFFSNITHLEKLRRTRQAFLTFRSTLAHNEEV